MRRAAVFPVASSVGVARSPRVGVRSIPCVVSGGWWVRAGVIRTASASCFGGTCWGCASPGVVRRSLGVGRRLSLRRGMPFQGVGRGACRSAVVPSSSVPRSPLLSLPGPWVVSCPHVVSLPVPCPYGRLPLRAPLPDCPLLPLAFPLPVPFPFPVRWWWGGGGRRWPSPGGGWPGAIGGGLGGCGGGGGPGPRRGGGPPMPLAT